MVGLGVFLLLLAAGLMVVVDYYFDSRSPKTAKIKVGSEEKTGEVVEIMSYEFDLRGFLMENGAKLLLMVVVAFLVVPMITDDTKIKMQQALAKLDSLGAKIEPPQVTDEDMSKMTLSADRKKLTLPKMEPTVGTWIIVTKDGKAFNVDDGENFSINEVLPPETKILKKDKQGRYSEARALGK
jgi:hypothetical protein